MRFLDIRFAAVCAVALLSAVVPVNAEQAQPTPPVESQTAAPAAPAAEPAGDPNEVICKKLESETGTRLGRRKECRTRKEWDQIAEEAKQNLEKAQD